MNNLFIIKQTLRKDINDIADWKWESSPSQPKPRVMQTIPLLTSFALSYWLKSPKESKKNAPIPQQNPRSERNTRLKPQGIIWLLSILLTFWLSPQLHSYWSDSPSKATSDPNQLNLDDALPVQTIAVGATKVNKVWRSYSGTLVARRQSSLSLERLGKIARITVDEGDRVSAGTILATLDTSKLVAKKQELLARRKQLLAEL